MSQNIELIELSDITETGHLFCNDCASEVNINLNNKTFIKYKHSHYDVDWKLPWHEFHNIIYIYPNLLKDIWDKNVRGKCPYCGCTDMTHIKPLDNGLFDIRLIKRSLKELEHPYVCFNCNKKFQSRRCVIKRTNDSYLCTDCAEFAQEN